VVVVSIEDQGGIERKDDRLEGGVDGCGEEGLKRRSGENSRSGGWASEHGSFPPRFQAP
jgi:hypothetical protein